MTEIEYVLDKFDDNFSQFREKRIVIHGSRNYAEAIVEHFKSSYCFIGVMSMDPIEGTSWHGLPIIGTEDLLKERVDIVLLTERVKYAEDAFRSLRKTCRLNHIDIYNMYGLDEFYLHYEASIAKPMSSDEALRYCEPYEMISFEVMDTVFPSMEKLTGLKPRTFFSDLIPKLRCLGKEIRFSLRKSFPEHDQIKALRDYEFLEDEEQELIRRTGEDLSFRRLKESAEGKRILYFGSGFVNEFVLPQYYGIDTILFVSQKDLDFDCLKPNLNHPERTPYNPEQKKSIKEAIFRHKLISFDIFDTLLIRKTLYPRDVFALTEWKAHEAGYQVDGFTSARTRVEDNCPFCTLEQIYENLAELYYWDTETEKALKELELETERMVLEPREAVVELLNYALQQGKRVILTSDMYLSESVLHELLNDKGIKGYERIIVSCDYKKSKSNGLYEQLQNCCSQTSDILHIGDNPDADGRMPQAHGIESIIIPSVFSIAMNGNWYDAIEEASSLMERCLLGMTISRLYADPFLNPNFWENPVDERTTHFGNSVIGPLLVGHMCWLIRNLQAGQYDGVLFLSRDGWLPLKLYDTINRRKTLPRAIYYYASRHSAFLCIADAELQADRIGEIGRSFGLTVEQVLEKVFLVPSEEMLPHDYKELNTEYIEKHIDRIQKIAESSRKGYLKYSKELGMKNGERYAVVDYVATGNIQKCLSQILPFSFHGYYYGTYSSESVAGKPIDYYLQGKNPAILRAFVELENYFSSPEPSVDYMSEQGFPVFQDEIRTEQDFQVIRSVWDAAVSFAQVFFDLFYQEGEIVHSSLIEEMYAATFFAIELPVYDDWFRTEIRRRPRE